LLYAKEKAIRERRSREKPLSLIKRGFFIRGLARV
jgi:hypothetical protein